MKIFITGGAGFIGSHICEELYNKIPNSKLLILDKVTYAANLKFISHLVRDKKRVKFIKADIIDSIKYKSQINYVIGDEWYAGNLSYHLKSRPKWVSINDKKALELMNSEERISLEDIYPALIIGNK